MGHTIVPAVEIGKIVTEAIAYCIYVTISPYAYMALRRKGFQGLISKYLHITFILLLVLNTTHVSIGIGRLIFAYNSYQDQPDLLEMYLSRLDNPWYLVKMACGLGVFMLVDGLTVLRIFILWGGSFKVVILPVLLLFTDIVYLVELMAVMSSERRSALTPTLAILAVLSWILNFSCSALIGYKLLQLRILREQSFESTSKSLNNAILILVVSTVVCSLICLGKLISAFLEKPSSYIFIDMLPSLVAIVVLYTIIATYKFQSQLDSNVTVQLALQLTRSTRPAPETSF